MMTSASVARYIVRANGFAHMATTAPDGQSAGRFHYAHGTRRCQQPQKSTERSALLERRRQEGGAGKQSDRNSANVITPTRCPRKD
jgi:hypothetical protein